MKGPKMGKISVALILSYRQTVESIKQLRLKPETMSHLIFSQGVIMSGSNKPRYSSLSNRKSLLSLLKTIQSSSLVNKMCTPISTHELSWNEKPKQRITWGHAVLVFHMRNSNSLTQFAQFLASSLHSPSWMVPKCMYVVNPCNVFHFSGVTEIN